MTNRAAFLSYASEDSDAAQRICEALRAAGVEVWFDQSELRGGDAWDASIRRQIKDCALFVPLISRNSDARGEGYFRLEWKLAVARSQLMADDEAFLLPVLIDDTAEQAARVPEAFRERQWTRPRDEAGILAFAERVRRLLHAPTDAPRPRAAAPRPPAASPAPGSRVAVLAFANLSEDKSNEYFSDGISEELLTVLQKISGLQVVARSSSFAFKGSAATAQEIGQKLGVAHLVEGSVRKAGQAVRIAARLVRAEDGEQLWSEAYTRDLDDVFAVQTALAQTIVEQLRTRLGVVMSPAARAEVRSEIDSAIRGGTRNPKAHESYLQGLFHLNRFSLSTARTARGCFEEATGIDPAFALAWAALARTGAQMGGYAESREEFESSWALARVAAERALALEPDLPAAHLARASMQMWHDFDWKGAQESVRRAQAHAGSDTAVAKCAAMLHYAAGRVREAVDIMLDAVTRDPLNVELRAALAWALYCVDRNAEAEAQCRRAAELNPAAPWSRAGVALLRLHDGRPEDALAEAQSEPAPWARLMLTSMSLWALGRRAEADAALDELARGYGDVAAVQIAQVYAFRGDVDRGFEWLDRSRLQRDPGIAWLKSDPTLAPLRGDPRWVAFLSAIGLADEQLNAQ